MSNMKNLEAILIDSFEDLKLDTNEKYNIASLIETLSHDQISFMRNKAFDIVKGVLDSNNLDSIKALKWLENIVKTLDRVRYSKQVHSSAYFSPGDDCLEKITALFESAKRSVDICVFTISDNRITEAILAANRRGIAVRIISDNDKANDRGSDVDRMNREGVDVVLDNSPYHMHHKFAIFDGLTLLNGSFNWTRSATEKNEENILVTNDENLVKLYRDRFNKIWVNEFNHAAG